MHVVGDIETDGFYDVATLVWVGVFYDLDTQVTTVFDVTQPNYMAGMLAYLDKVDTLYMHNGFSFDIPVIEKLTGWKFKGRLVDTLLLSRLEYPKRHSHSIESWGEEFGIPKPAHSEWDRYSREMVIRCKEDVRITHELMKRLNFEDIQDTTRHKVVQTLFKHLDKQEKDGWTLDKEHLEFSLHMLTKWKNRIRRSVSPYLPLVVENHGPVKKPFKRDGTLAIVAVRYLDSVGIDGSNVSGPFTRVDFRTLSVDSLVELKEMLLSQGWEPAEWNYSKKDGSVTSPKLSQDDPFKGIEGNLGRLLARYVQIKQREGILLGWKSQVRPDGKLSGRVAGLATTSRARHAVIANIPRVTTFFGKWMRKCFIARKGWVMVGVDAIGCQLRMLAARMNDPTYTQTVLEGDIHTANQQAAGLKTRYEAKEFIYSIVFGEGDTKTGKRVGGGAKEGRAVKSKFFAALPELARVIKEETSKWQKTATYRMGKFGRPEYRDGYILGLDGRHIPVDSQHKVLMGCLQSDEAILMQYAINLCHNKLVKLGIDSTQFTQLIWYHDEVQFECHPDIAEQLGRTMSDSINQAGKMLNLACPMDGEYKIGNNWAETH